MSRYDLHLTGGDWAKASPGEPDSCLIAVGLSRDLGGSWTVAKGKAVEWTKGGEVKRELRLGSNGRSVMWWFDLLGLKTGSTVTLYGDVKAPAAAKRKGKRRHAPPAASPARPRKRLSAGKRAALGTTATAATLGVTGFWWVDAIAAGAAALTMGGAVAVRRGWVHVPKPGMPAPVPKPDGVPSWRELRGMAPRERGAAYRRAVAAPEPLGAAPEPVTQPSVPVAPPAPPRPRWPIAAPREVEGVSHRSAIPDHVPDHLVQREQARATERGQS